MSFSSWTTRRDCSCETCPKLASALSDKCNRDTPELKLSRKQMEVFGGWKRAEEALPPPTWISEENSQAGPSMTFAKKVDLVQDAATDCSVVASLCAGTARAERGHPKVGI